MKSTLKLMLPAVAMVIGLAATSASAAPAGAGLAPLKTLPEATTAVENANWVRKCHRTRWGRVHCHLEWVKPHRRHYHGHHGHHGYGRRHHY